MILHAQGSTDTRRMGLFWPAHLPGEPSLDLADGDHDLFELVDYHHDLLVDLDGQGRLISLPCDGFGTVENRIGVYVDEDPTVERLRYYKKAHFYPDVIVKGPTYFGGLEYLFDRKFEVEIENYIGLCETLNVSEGSYEVSTFTLGMTPDQIDTEMEKIVGLKTMQWVRFHNQLAGVGCLLILVECFALIFALWNGYLWGFIWVAAFFVIVPSLYKLHPAFAKADEGMEELSKEFPHYLVTMRKKAD